VKKEDSKIAIELSVAQWNIVLNAVTQRPFAEVNDLVQEMIQQANSKVIAPAELPPEEQAA
jgi:hypothetical protein